MSDTPQPQVKHPVVMESEDDSASPVSFDRPGWVNERPPIGQSIHTTVEVDNPEDAPRPDWVTERDPVGADVSTPNASQIPAPSVNTSGEAADNEEATADSATTDAGEPDQPETEPEPALAKLPKTSKAAKAAEAGDDSGNEAPASKP